MRNEDLYLNIINTMSDGVYYVDTERRIMFWNRAAEAISGYSADEMVGRRCDDNILNHIDIDGRPLCIVGCPLYATMIDEKIRKHEVFLRHKDGRRVPVFVNIYPVKENGVIIGALEIFAPNSPIVYNDDLVEQLSNMAMRDALTELPNRRYVQSFLEYKISEFKRVNAVFAVLFLDIDNFSFVNNTYGHDVGDLALKSLADANKKRIRKTDMFGRWGGEEFIGVYSIKAEYDAPIIAEKVRKLIAETVIPYENPFSITASIGITVSRGDDTSESLIERADKLMYQSKKTGKNKVSCD